MSGHLTNSELVECLEQVLPPERRDHSQTCEKCRRDLEVLRVTLQNVERAEPRSIPEPSPLFWEHFSRRVSEAIAEEDPIRHQTWLKSLVPIAAALVLCAGVLAMWLQNRSTGAPVPAARSVAAPTATPLVPDEPLDLDADVEWSLVQVAADELEWEGAADAGIRANPGSAERVALEMSAGERRELERLIEAEIKQTGA